MANDISANPWKIDTPGAGVIYAFPVKITNIIWANFTTAADALVMTDVNGKVIVNALVATTSQGMMSFGGMGWVRGLIVSSLTHGVVTIAIGAGR
jgi:hypothetical protein